jgi:hypothetical protein
MLQKEAFLLPPTILFRIHYVSAVLKGSWNHCIPELVLLPKSKPNIPCRGSALQKESGYLMIFIHFKGDKSKTDILAVRSSSVFVKVFYCPLQHWRSMWAAPLKLSWTHLGRSAVSWEETSTWRYRSSHRNIIEGHSSPTHPQHPALRPTSKPPSLTSAKWNHGFKNNGLSF